VNWEPPSEGDARPSRAFFLVALIVYPLLALALVSAVLQVAEILAGVDYFTAREQFGISAGLVLMRIVDIIIFRQRR
jgi:hypothetical protein